MRSFSLYGPYDNNHIRALLLFAFNERVEQLDLFGKLKPRPVERGQTLKCNRNLKKKKSILMHAENGDYSMLKKLLSISKSQNTRGRRRRLLIHPLPPHQLQFTPNFDPCVQQSPHRPGVSSIRGMLSSLGSLTMSRKAEIPI